MKPRSHLYRHPQEIVTKERKEMKGYETTQPPLQTPPKELARASAFGPYGYSYDTPLPSPGSLGALSSCPPLPQPKTPRQEGQDEEISDNYLCQTLW